jgi:pyroglutamyl-peptidase
MLRLTICTNLKTGTLVTLPSQPFGKWPVNASYVIASTLPPAISPSSNNPLSRLRKINLIVHKPEIRTSYHVVRTEIPKFFAEHKDKDIDLVLHMGIGYPEHYTIETQSFRDDYNQSADVDGQYARDLSDLPGGEHLWRDVYKAPEILETAVQPVDELWRRTESLLLGKGNTVDVRLSDDPGHYLCGFIYYEGLVERWWHGEQRNVLFLHVRPWVADEVVQEGREVAMAVIRAAVEMIEKRRDNEKAKADGLGSCCVVS